MHPRNAFIHVVEANAHFPWHHTVDPFCKCSNCHAHRQQRLLDKCARIEAAVNTLNDETLEWSAHPSSMPPPAFAFNTPTPTPAQRPILRKSGVITK